MIGVPPLPTAFALPTSYGPTSAAAEKDIEGFLTYSIYIPENQHVPYKRHEDSKGKGRLPITIFSGAMLVLGGVAHKINPAAFLFQ